MTDGITYVAAAGDTRALVAVIDLRPGYLYSGRQQIEVMADDTVHVNYPGDINSS